MFHFDYLTEGTCSRLISMDIDGDVIKNVKFVGGCAGNLTAIPILVDGWTVEQIEQKLKGIMCGTKETSCSDQLSRAVRAGLIASKDPNYVPPVIEELI